MNKIATMLTKDLIEQIIRETVDIVPEGEDSVFLGTCALIDTPAFGAIMDYVTGFYDCLLQSSNLSDVQRLILQMQRCFTFDEYKAAFRLSIQPHQFSNHAIYKTLLLTTNSERLLFIRNQKGDESFQAYQSFLSSWSEVFNPRLYSLIYEVHN